MLRSIGILFSLTCIELSFNPVLSEPFPVKIVHYWSQNESDTTTLCCLNSAKPEVLPKLLTFSLRNPTLQRMIFSRIFNHEKFHYNNNFRVLPISLTIAVSWANKCSAVGLEFISPGKWVLPHKQGAPSSDLMTRVSLTLLKFNKQLRRGKILKVKKPITTTTTDFPLAIT